MSTLVLHQPEHETQSPNSTYLKTSLEPLLSRALHEVCQARPFDPIEYLAKYLYKSVDLELYYYEKCIFAHEMQLLALQLEEENQNRQSSIKIIKKQIRDLKRVIRGEYSSQAAIWARYAKSILDKRVCDKQGTILTGTILTELLAWEGDEAVARGRREMTDSSIGSERSALDLTREPRAGSQDTFLTIKPDEEYLTKPKKKRHRHIFDDQRWLLSDEDSDYDDLDQDDEQGSRSRRHKRGARRRRSRASDDDSLSGASSIGSMSQARRRKRSLKRRGSKLYDVSSGSSSSADSYEIDPVTGKRVLKKAFDRDLLTGERRLKPGYEIDPETGEIRRKQVWEIDPVTGQRRVRVGYEIDPETGEPRLKKGYEIDPETGKVREKAGYAIDPATGVAHRLYSSRKCRWYLAYPRVLVCHHPILGHLRSKQRLLISAKESLDRLTPPEYCWQSTYDHELYTVEDPYHDDENYEAQMMEWKEEDWE